MLPLYPILKALFLFMLMGPAISLSAQDNPFGKNENWTPEQLMEPAVLANRIQTGEQLPYIISIGPSAIIPHSTDVGMVVNREPLEKLNLVLDALPKNSEVVIYCGCCPFERCPNIRPAISVLKNKNFKNFYLLNLNNSIKTDWIDKNYPLTPEK